MVRRGWRTLLTVALDQRGFVTPDDAVRVGVDPAQLRVLAHRGSLERRARGVYRFPEVPVGEHDEYQEAVLVVGHGAVVSHDSALALLELCDVNPRRVHVTVPAGERVRRRIELPVQIHYGQLDRGDITSADGIPVVTAARAVEDALTMGIDARLLAQAITTARREGHLTGEEAANLRRRLDVRATIAL